jgi:hypothetical protein
MHEINDAIVRDGKIVVSNLPFADGQHVRVTVTEIAQTAPRLPIHKVRDLLKGGVERFNEPFEPMIPEKHWEMLR